MDGRSFQNALIPLGLDHEAQPFAVFSFEEVLALPEDLQDRFSIKGVFLELVAQVLVILEECPVFGAVQGGTPAELMSRPIGAEPCCKHGKRDRQEDHRDAERMH